MAPHNIDPDSLMGLVTWIKGLLILGFQSKDERAPIWAYIGILFGQWLVDLKEHTNCFCLLMLFVGGVRLEKTHPYSCAFSGLVGLAVDFGLGFGPKYPPSGVLLARLLCELGLPRWMRLRFEEILKHVGGCISLFCGHHHIKPVAHQLTWGTAVAMHFLKPPTDWIGKDMINNMKLDMGVAL